MATYIDGDDTLWLGNYIVSEVFSALDGPSKDRAMALSAGYGAECYRAATRARTAEELVAEITRVEQTYMPEGGRLLAGLPVSTLTRGRWRPNERVVNVACRAASNGGLVIMSAEDERTVDSFAAANGLAGYKKVCSRLAAEDGLLTGEFEKLVTAADKAAGYRGGPVYENGINGIGIIAKAVGAGERVNICGADTTLRTALRCMGLTKFVNYF